MAGPTPARLDAKKKPFVNAGRDEAERATWKEAHAGLDPSLMVSVDESGSNETMAPRYGWAPRGQRVIDIAPRKRGPNTTILAALTPKAIFKMIEQRVGTGSV